SVSALRSDVPSPLDDVIRKACAKDRADRFANTDELSAALERAVAPPARAASTTLEDPSPPMVPDAPRAMHRPAVPWFLAIVGGGVIALAAVGGIVLWPRPKQTHHH